MKSNIFSVGLHQLADKSAECGEHRRLLSLGAKQPITSAFCLSGRKNDVFITDESVLPANLGKDAKEMAGAQKVALDTFTTDSSGVLPKCESDLLRLVQLIQKHLRDNSIQMQVTMSGAAEAAAPDQPVAQAEPALQSASAPNTPAAAAFEKETKTALSQRLKDLVMQAARACLDPQADAPAAPPDLQQVHKSWNDVRKSATRGPRRLIGEIQTRTSGLAGLENAAVTGLARPLAALDRRLDAVRERLTTAEPGPERQKLTHATISRSLQQVNSALRA